MRWKMWFTWFNSFTTMPKARSIGMRAAFSALQLIYKDRNKKYLLHILKLVTFMNIKTFLFWFQIKFYINLKPNINIQHCVEVFGLFYLLKRRRLSCLCFYAPSFSLGCDSEWKCKWIDLTFSWYLVSRLRFRIWNVTESVFFHLFWMPNGYWTDMGTQNIEDCPFIMKISLNVGIFLLKNAHVIDMCLWVMKCDIYY